MKQTLRGELVQFLPVAAMFVVAALCWSHVPDRIAVHWGLQGKPDGFAGRISGLLLLPIVSLAVYLLTLFLPSLDPGRANYRNFAGAYNAIRFSITLFLSLIYMVMVLTALGTPSTRYIGAAGSAAAELAIAAEARRRLERETEDRQRLAEQRSLQEITEPLLALCQVTDVLTRAALIGAGFYQHDRGEWRHRREQQNSK